MPKVSQSLAVAGFASDIRTSLPGNAGATVIKVLSALEGSLNLGLKTLAPLVDPTDGFQEDQLGHLSIDTEYIRTLLGRYQISDPPPVQVISAVGNGIYPTGSWVKISNTTGGSITLTSTPTIAPGVDGQDIELINIGTQNVVIQDFGTLANSAVQLATGASKTLAPGQVWIARFCVNIGRWCGKAA